MNVGVLAIQGDVSEHATSAKRAMDELGYEGDVLLVKRSQDLERVDYLIIPGGESTTISRLMLRWGIYDKIREMYGNGDLAVIGTCAGSILMSKRIVDDDRVKPLGLMNMETRRNFFGRQRESFETDLDVLGIGRYHAIFIRAPVIENCWGNCEILAKIGDKIAMAREGRAMALIFHPELTKDYRIYRLFFQL